MFSPYRHIVKTDAGKPLISPEVDAADPVGSLIGSYVIRGKDVPRLRPLLESALSSPGEFLDELPEFTIPVTVREADRREFATTATRMLKAKNLKPTRDAVSILHGLTGSPYDVARALNQLEKEDTVRDVRPDELRYALGTLEAERILPEHSSPTVSKVVHALLRANEPLSRDTLADVARVSERSIRNNRGALEALGIVSVDGRGWRLNLSFRTTEERRSQVVPEFVTGAFIDAVDALLEAVLSPGEYADPDGIGGVLYWPPEPWELVDHPDLEQWVRLAARLTGTERPDNETSISVGPEINQTAITDAGAIA